MANHLSAPMPMWVNKFHGVTTVTWWPAASRRWESRVSGCRRPRRHWARQLNFPGIVL